LIFPELKYEIPRILPSLRKLIKVLDVFGRSVTSKPNMTLLYIYSDGSTEKKLIIE
jgi:hypothetical protein